MFETKDVEKIKTHVLCSITFFENSAVYEIVCKNFTERGWPQMTIWLMYIACWVAKTSHTLSFSLSICKTYCFSTAIIAIGYSYIACLVVDIKELSIVLKQYIYLYRISLTIKLYYFTTCTESISFLNGSTLCSLSDTN
jgi:hypothetical protein